MDGIPAASSPGRSAAERVDLSHLTGHDLRSALELQLSLQKKGAAVARLSGNEVEVRIALPSGDERLVFFTASNLPGALPMLRSLPTIRLEGELAKLELSEARLRPVLLATWNDQGISLEPGYRLGVLLAAVAGLYTAAGGLAIAGATGSTSSFC